MKGRDFPPLFIDLFTKTMGMDEQEFELFCSHFREMTLRKKDYYLKEGNITNAKGRPIARITATPGWSASRN